MKSRKRKNSLKQLKNRRTRQRNLQVESLEDRRLLAVLGNPLYRINAGGSELAASPVWQADTGASPASYLVDGNTAVSSTGNTIDTSSPSIPAGTPMELFQTERFDKAGPGNMEWDFPVTPGDYEVRLYFAETWSGAFSTGVRAFDVSIEGALALDNYDVFAAAGPLTGIVESFTVTSDSVLDIDFGRVSQNPSIKGIEIIPWVDDQSSSLAASSTTVAFDDTLLGETVQQVITLTNNGVSGAPDITIDPALAELTPSTTPFSFQFEASTPIVLAAGQSTTVTIQYSPTAEAIDTATLSIPHDGDGSPLDIALSGTGVAETTDENILYRVNAGGSELAGTPVWTEDSSANPSPYSNAQTDGNSGTNSNTETVSYDSSVPVGTPTELFQTQRFDNPSGGNMEWDFDVSPGIYEVRLYFVEVYSDTYVEGGRVFDISIEDAVVEPNYDIYADVGELTAVMKSYLVSSDANLDIDFGRVTQNPTVAGIEIVAIPSGTLLPSTTEVDFGGVLVDDTSIMQVTLTNDHPSSGPDITIDPTQATLSPESGPFSFVFTQMAPIVLAPGEATTLTVTYSPTAEATDGATLTIPHSDSGSPLQIQLSGAGVTEVPVSFQKSVLSNTTGLSRPTSMQFGPDGRLYISQQSGLIRVYDVVQNGANDYEVVQAETISLLQTILNHDDDGTPRPDITTRLVTGILVVGTAENPVIYVGSSDPRIGGGNDGEDTNLDTNSSIISRLTYNGSSWEKLDLVRGLPRSDEQHAINGMVLDPNDPTILYVTVGGNTNMGAPSNNFAFLPEYAYSAAILTVDLAAIGETTYDLPTLDDEDQPGVDVSDPFGGNNGKNQAILEANGPVQIYAAGLRNPFDIVIDEQGRMYSIDNGPNAGWGGLPINEGPEGNATNDVNEADSETHGDGLHYITGEGYYGGHPNPTRSNMNNTFNVSNPQSPIFENNPIESDYQEPGVDDGSLVVYPYSTNGMAVYGAGTFGGAMQGDLLTASFDNTIKRIKLNAAGDAIEFSEDLFSNVGFRPLDVIAPAAGPYTGSIWVIDIATNAVYVFEPQESSNGTEDDRDGDGYSNDDELANNTNPDNPADVPADYDGDFLSNLLDPDDDNDSILDEVDYFAIDPDNGLTTPVGTFYSWENEGEDLGGILGMGFTGLMSNGVDNYELLFDAESVTAGGAAGVFTVDAAGAGTALGSANTQFQGFQFGFNASGETVPFAATTRVLAPFGGHTPQAGQEMGLTLGLGDQDNFVQLVLSGEGGGAIQVVSEFDGVDTVVASQALTLPGPSSVDFWLTIDPIAMTMQASYAIDDGLRTDLGAAIAIPSSWLAGAMAAGIISRDAVGDSLPVTWDHLGVVSDAPSDGHAAAKVEAYPFGSINNSSTARDDSFRIYNNSTNGSQITSILIDLSTSFMPDMLFDPNGTAGDTRGIDMIAQQGVLETGQLSHSFLSPRDGGFAQLQINFSDFDAAELFTFRTDVDPTSVQGSVPPGPSNAADISGLEIAGATITITFDDNTQLAGQLFALDEGVDFYKVHSEVVMTEDPITAAPIISLLGASTPGIVTSASQTIRVTGPAGASVRLLQTEVALHLDGVPGGGFDIDPYEGNKVVNVFDEVATIGLTGYVDIPVTLSDTLEAGGLNYFTAVIEEPDGRTTDLSNVVKVALNDLPPGSTTGSGGNEAPSTSSVIASPDETTSGPITVTAVATDSADVVAAAEYFIDTVGAEGTGTPLAATDGAFDETAEDLTGAISASLFDGLSVGTHTLYVRSQDAQGLWGTVATTTFTKLGTGEETVLYRVNAGGQEVAGDPVWGVDTAASPSIYGNGGDADSNSRANSTNTAIDTSHASIPAGTPMSVFQSNRADPPNGTNIEYDFPVTPGQYTVRLYFAEIWEGAFSVGTRNFDVEIEGVVVLDNYDIFAAAGAGYAGVVETLIVSSDDNLDINLLRGALAPQVSGIEIIGGTTGGSSNQSPSASGVLLSPASTTSGPISITATADDTDGTITAAEYFIDTIGAEGTGIAMSAGDGTFDEANESVTATISAATFDGLSIGEHTIYVRALDSDGAWSTVASATLTKEEVIVAENVLLRINAGGEAVAGDPTWEADTAADPHEFSNAGLNEANSDVLTTTATIDTTDASLPAGTPASIFQTSRFDNPENADLAFDIPLGIGEYEVRFYFAEIDPNSFGEGLRVFDVSVEEQLVLDDFDIYAAAGMAGNKGIMRSFIVSSSSELDIDFFAETGNPMVSAIEILPFEGSGTLAAFTTLSASVPSETSEAALLDDVFADEATFEADNGDLLLLLAQSSSDEEVATISTGSSEEAEETADIFADFGLDSEL
ncbi:malectin domain-containing carbohydrate-binding protein [Aeoliella sp. ICT_H6.2]|uniref:Malectin domain-containing carbohydrate-binding protein n=1 Tax=Aeoliella straminimaris TaxID=2954799 RepID=A0A9X2JK22_9BACT|nr:malectin domain-containing carbohydrate-binding protein [Aeoliella straminimaris]MCO6047518.1 malectin domain-containing carbohydrate-binding protein [Aeoliella straminimaris]